MGAIAVMIGLVLAFCMVAGLYDAADRTVDALRGWRGWIRPLSGAVMTLGALPFAYCLDSVAGSVVAGIAGLVVLLAGLTIWFRL